MSVATVESYLQTSECGEVAATALLAFDYCLTLGQEVKWLHGTRWTATRIHFTCFRYLPFVALAMALSTSRLGTSHCFLAKATKVVYYLCIALAEVMLIIRTYAFWKRDRKILIGMCVFGVVCMVVAAVTSQTIPSEGSYLAYAALECFGAESKLAMAIPFVCLIIYEMGMLGLNWIAFRKMKFQMPPGQLITTLYRDGVMYVAGTLLFSAFNTVVALATPSSYGDVFNSAQMVMHSLLASRIFFNLREMARREQEDMFAMSLSEFRVAPSGSSDPGFGRSADLEHW